MQKSTFISYLIARASISLAGTMLSVAVGWHLYQLTGNPFDLALVGLVQVAPILSLFMITGWVVDHFPRKVILVLCAAVETLVLIALALVMNAEKIDTTAIFILLFFHGCARAFYSPAQQAILPNIVSKAFLSQAVAITSSVWNAASTGGPFIAGLLIAWLDLNTYWVIALLSAIGIVLFFSLPTLTHLKPTEKGLAQLLGGIHFIKANPIVLGSISIDLFIVLAGSVVALLPIYAIDILHVGPEALGVLRAMPALGAVMIGIVMAKSTELRNSGRMLFISLAIFSFSILLFAFSTSYWLSLIALWIYGASDMVSVNIRSTLVQIATPDKLRGRVSAVNSIFIASSNKVGDFRAGAVATVLPPIATVTLGGIMALGITLGSYILFPKIRKLDKLTDAHTDTNSEPDNT